MMCEVCGSATATKEIETPNSGELAVCDRCYDDMIAREEQEAEAAVERWHELKHGQSPLIERSKR